MPVYVLRYTMPFRCRTEIEFSTLREVIAYLRQHPGIRQKANDYAVYKRIDIEDFFLGEDA